MVLIPAYSYCPRIWRLRSSLPLFCSGVSHWYYWIVKDSLSPTFFMNYLHIYLYQISFGAHSNIGIDLNYTIHIKYRIILQSIIRSSGTEIRFSLGQRYHFILIFKHGKTSLGITDKAIRWTLPLFKDLKLKLISKASTLHGPFANHIGGVDIFICTISS